MEKLTINIMLIGKSGAGKSSLANYIFGEKIFAEGKGRPVTSWPENFQTKSIEQKQYVLNLIDTVGLEPDNYKDWDSKMSDFFGRKYDSDNPSDWVHGVFYVINAASARFETNEAKIIENISHNYLCPPVIVLTNCDKASKEEVDSLQKTIKDVFESKPVDIINVCSVKIKKRGGEFSEPFGKEELLTAHLKKSAYIILNRICAVTLKNSCSSIEELIRKVKDEIDASNLNAITITKEAINEKSSGEFERVLSSLEEGIENLISLPKTLELIELYNSFKYYLFSFDIINDFDLDLETLIENVFDRVGSEQIAIFEKIEDDLESGSFFEKVRGLVSVLSMVIFIKTTIKKFLTNFSNNTQKQFSELARYYEDQCRNPPKPAQELSVHDLAIGGTTSHIMLSSAVGMKIIR